MTSIKDPIERMRSYISKNFCHPYCASMNEMLDEIEAQYMRLPLDADGVPIRPGDEVECVIGTKADARSITFFEDTVDVGSDGWNPRFLRHVKPETKTALWIDEDDYNRLVDAKDERDRLRAEVKKLGEQLDRLRNDEGMA